MMLMAMRSPGLDRYFKGRNKPHRGDRKWVKGRSPEQIANRLQIDFPDDESARLSSHEFRHVHQYEALGSIENFMEVYLEQVLAFGYARAPLEMDVQNSNLHDKQQERCLSREPARPVRKRGACRCRS